MALCWKVGITLLADNMKDYTCNQSAPIAEIKNFPDGKNAITMNREAQQQFKNEYSFRPEYIHLIVSRDSCNKPWYISHRRDALIQKYPKDKMVFAKYGDTIRFVGWLFLKEISDNYESTPLGYFLDYPLREMATFSLKDANIG